MTAFNRIQSLALSFVLLAVSGAFVPFAQADTLLSTTGSEAELFGNTPEGVSWTTTGSYTNVSVAALISSGSASQGGGGTFYLTNSVGPGTTALNVLAETTVSNIGFQPTVDTSLFSGLTLGPGTYYLISSSDLTAGGLDWEALGGPAGPVVTAGPGTTFNGEVFSFDTGAFPPADSFNPLLGPTFGVDVTGAPLATVTPEPGSLVLLGTGLLGVVGAVRRRSAPSGL